MNTPDQFNAAWNAAQPVEVQSLIASTPVGPDRTAHLDAMAAKGVSLDPQILEYGLPPFWVMQARVWYGYYDPQTGKGWVPAIGQPFIETPPGISFPNRPVYDPNSAPAGSIKVVDPTNCNLAIEYPPAVAPTPPPAAEPTNLVDLSRRWPDQDQNGKLAYYSTLAGWRIPTGQIVPEGGQQWIKISVGSPFVPYQGWRQV